MDDRGADPIRIREETKRDNGIYIPFSLFCPFILNFIGLVWKDTALAVCWLASASLVLCSIDIDYENKKARAAIILLSYAFFAFGLISRHNALPAAPFFLAGLFITHAGIGNLGLSPQKFRRTVLFGLACVAISIITVVTSNALLRSVYSVRKVDMFASVVIYDMAGVTVRSGRNTFPVDFTPPEQEAIKNCYQLNDLNSYADASKCLFVYQKFATAGWIGKTKLKLYWIQSILMNPVSYIHHRFAVFANFIRFNQDTPYYIQRPGIDENDLGLTHPMGKNFV